jgi:hypothetical protein
MDGSASDKPNRKRGRPATGRDPMIGFRAGPDMVQGLEAAARGEGEPKSEIMRKAVAEWLRARGYMG